MVGEALKLFKSSCLDQTLATSIEELRCTAVAGTAAQGRIAGRSDGHPLAPCGWVRARVSFLLERLGLETLHAQLV